MTDWRDISTAPLTGEHVMIAAMYDGNWFVCEAYFEHDGDRGWYQANTHWTDAYDGCVTGVVYWQPLPPSPTGTAAAASGGSLK